MITEILFSVIALYGLGFNGAHNITEWDCPIIDGEWRSYDLLDRGWCHLNGLVQPLEPERNYDDDDD